MKIIGRALILGLTALFGIGTVGMSVSCGRDDRYNIAMFAYKYDDSYISTVRTALASKFRAHSAEIAYTAYNGENSQQTQSTQIDAAIIKGADLLLINAVDFKAVKALKQASKKPLFCLVFIEKPLFFSNSNFQFPKFSPRSRVGAKEQNQPRGIFSYGAVFLCFLPIFSLFSPQKGIN